MNRDDALASHTPQNLASALEAFRSGRLAEYQPLVLARADRREEACMTSWGPQMKR